MTVLATAPRVATTAPLVSVVIVGYHSREALEPCLASVAACREVIPLECILVDNASRDGTVPWVRDVHPWVCCVENAENEGFTRGVNRGLALARGANLLVLNPDCEIGAVALRALLDAAATPGVAAVAPALVDTDGRTARSCGRFPSLWTLVCDHLGLARAFAGHPLFGAYKYGGVTLAALDRVDWASGAALLVPRMAYERLGGLDERIFMYMEEVDWCRRAAAAGLAVRYVPHARIVHVGQLSSRKAPTATYLHNLRSRVYYFRKHHGPLVALAARTVLSLSLVAKWTVTWPRPAARARARIYAAGLASVWGA